IKKTNKSPAFMKSSGTRQRALTTGADRGPAHGALILKNTALKPCMSVHSENCTSVLSEENFASSNKLFGRTVTSFMFSSPNVIVTYGYWLRVSAILARLNLYDLLM